MSIYFGIKQSSFLNLYASDKNNYGQMVQVLFITQSGAEGLNLKMLEMFIL